MSDDSEFPNVNRQLSTLDLSDTGEADHYDDADTHYHHQLYTGEIADPHIHLFNFDLLEYPWLKGPKQLKEHGLLGNLDPVRKPYLLSDLEADSKNQNVTKWVHVEADPSDAYKEAEWIESLTKSHPSIAGIIGHSDLTSPSASSLLSKLAALPHVKGIRQIVNWHHSKAHLRGAKDYLSDPTWQQNYALLGKHKLHFEFHGYSEQLHHAVQLAAKHPEIPLIINHAGLCLERTEEAIEQWKEQLTALAAHKNTAIKISGLGQPDHSWTAESIRPFVRSLIDIFGYDRCMFASNFPVDKLVATYDSYYLAFKQIVANCTPEQQKKLFYDNAVAFYRL